MEERNERLIAFARQAIKLGFTQTAEIPVDALVCKPEIRALCTPEKCSNYGTNWICPPGSGELPELEARIREYDRALLVQRVYEHVDTTDLEACQGYSTSFSDLLAELVEDVRAVCPGALVLTTGGCHRCEKCTYPDAPCCKPEEKQGSLSAYGIDVGELCEHADLPFSFADDTLYFVGVVLV